MRLSKPPFPQTPIATSVHLICKYWNTQQIVEDPRIGPAVAAASKRPVPGRLTK